MQKTVNNMQNPVIHPQNWRYNYIPKEQQNEFILLNGGFTQRLSNWNLVAENVQHFWVLWYNFEPGAVCISGDQYYELTPDKILLIPPHTVYTGQVNQPVPHFFLWFQTAAPFDSPIRKIIEIPSEQYLDLLKQSINQNKRTKLCHSNLIGNLLLNIPEAYFQSQSNQHNSRVIEKAIYFIRQHNGQISNSQIAEYIHLSPPRFQHLFKTELGISPQRYCMQLKMSKAESFLQTGFSIEQTAEFCGFFDRFHFSKEFKKYHGISPAKWLKQFTAQLETRAKKSIEM